MGRSFIKAELSGAASRVRVQTYEYDTPAEEIRRPSQHHLALILTRRSHDPGAYLGRLSSGRTFAIGNLIYVPATQSIWGEGPGGPHTLVTCAFPTGTHRALAAFERSLGDEDLTRCANLRSDWIVDMMRRLAHEALNPGFASDILLDSLTAALPVELHRLLEPPCRPQPLRRGGLSPRQLRTIEDYVHNWPSGGIKVADLAGLVGLSRGHFMRAFKQSTDMTVHAFVEKVRLDRAQALLMEGQLSIKQIAAQLGFADPSSFTLAFRRKTGLAPGQYRVSRGLPG